MRASPLERQETPGNLEIKAARRYFCWHLRSGWVKAEKALSGGQPRSGPGSWHQGTGGGECSVQGADGQPPSPAWSGCLRGTCLVAVPPTNGKQLLLRSTVCTPARDQGVRGFCPDMSTPEELEEESSSPVPSRGPRVQVSWFSGRKTSRALGHPPWLRVAVSWPSTKHFNFSAHHLTRPAIPISKRKTGKLREK